MAVFVYTPDSDTHDSLVLPNSRDYDRLNLFTGKELAKAWRPLSVRVVKGKKRSDFPSLASHVPVFTRRALDTLYPLVAPHIEALPLKSTKGEFFAINVLLVTECLDLSRSEVKFFSSGGIMRIARYAFDMECVRGQDMFKLRQVPLYEVYVSDEFKRQVEGAGLQGLIFRKVA